MTREMASQALGMTVPSRHVAADRCSSGRSAKAPRASVNGCEEMFLSKVACPGHVEHGSDNVVAPAKMERKKHDKLQASWLTWPWSDHRIDGERGDGFRASHPSPQDLRQRKGPQCSWLRSSERRRPGKPECFRHGVSLEIRHAARRLAPERQWRLTSNALPPLFAARAPALIFPPDKFISRSYARI